MLLYVKIARFWRCNLRGDGGAQGKSDDYEIAAAQVGVEVFSAMNAALGQ